ncbi:3-dehydroquinate synthase [Buchnera aphidicola (Thelaxes californica)]|uniref:3-dehydroquinate synthase n=1 Tax=Buchnera aphidicola (Thelaxes californica) TaxID=1315998 RepID=A0A4D6YMF6_9GAMM|nr:3-dehydroquinate synthase [Buchnera aphidicola]QCI26938.1 3-dehydroquinate synthase [Buchnera aphidicola (Thelaxes californica)]
MHKLKMNLTNCSYPILVGSSIFKKNHILNIIKNKSTIVLITNVTIATLWKKYIFNFSKKINIQYYEFIISDGEEYKSMLTVEKCITFLLKKQCNRDTILIALGGGVIGDLTGFIAGIYQRGIEYIQVPTTLLAQVDASIGGKTGVNHVLGKNMLGVFWHPSSVIIDTNFLNTLSKQEFLSGMAEVIKYAIIFDKDFFHWLEKKYIDLINLNTESILYCVKKCCELKISIVEKDEREKNIRAFLNLGHTFGHAIEAYFKYEKWLHGEAVSMGIVIATKIAYLLKLISQTELLQIIDLLKNLGLPITAPKNMKSSEYISYMHNDKKSFSNGKIRLILPKKIGEVFICENIDNNIILQAIDASK